MKSYHWLSIFCILFIAPVSLLAQPVGTDEATTLTAPDGTPVVIYRDNYGVPHVRAASEVGVFFGQGFAAAEDRLFQMETFRRAALGRLSEVGLGSVANDQLIRTVFYTESERQEQFDALSSGVREMFEAYVAGLNAYLERVAADPVTYKPAEFFALGFDPEPWTVDHAVAATQFFMRRFGMRGGQELDRLAELQAHGPEWFERNRPVNDPGVPTTIPGGAAPAAKRIRQVGRGIGKHAERPVSSELIVAVAASREAMTPGSGFDLPEKLGSFAVLIDRSKTARSTVMLLGAPQTSTLAVDRVNDVFEVELDAPSLHVSGMALAGIPGVIIGRTAHHAWTLTSGRSDNTDVYIEILNDTGTQYFFDGAFEDFEVIQEPDLGFAHLRSVHGPVVGVDASAGQAASLKMTFWNRELDMVEAFFDIWKATDLHAFEAALPTIPISFNVFYAGTDRRVKYWHVGRYQDRSDGVDPRLPHLGDGSQEWGGFIPFAALPKADNPPQGYFVNWNNKPVGWWNQGDDVPWAITPDEPDDVREAQALRVNAIDNVVGPIRPFRYDDLRSVPAQIDTAGTYQQALEFTPRGIIDENIIPPGQSGFLDAMGTPSPHFGDQWALHLNDSFKDMAVNDPVDLRWANHQYRRINVARFVDPAFREGAYIQSVWSDEPDAGGNKNGSEDDADEVESGGPDVVILDCQTVLLRADHDRPGNGRVYTLHVASPDRVGAVGTSALFQVRVPRWKQRTWDVTDDGPAYKVETGCGVAGKPQPRLATAPSMLHEAQETPDGFVLEQNYPNPFNPATEITFRVPEAGVVRLSVYDVTGREVARLVDGALEAGTHRARFEASALPSGVYFYRIQAGAFTQTRPMTLVK